MTLLKIPIYIGPVHTMLLDMGDIGFMGHMGGIGFMGHTGDIGL